MDIPHKCKFCNVQLTLENRRYVNKKTGYYYICFDCCYKCIQKKIIPQNKKSENLK